MNSNHATTLGEFREDWQTVQGAVARSLRVTGSLPGQEERLDDRFDCDDLRVPSIHTQIDQISTDFVRRWKTLDHRKIIPNGERPAWYQRRVRLPENFRFDQAPVENPHATEEDERVICLENPANTLSYRSELWKLMKKVPTAAKLEVKTFSGHGLRRVAALADKYPTRKRLRLAQHHDHVVPLQSTGPLVATIRFECWKKRPSLDCLPDKNRLVLEFTESQTLRDVDQALVVMAASPCLDGKPIADGQGFFFIEGIFYVSKDTLALKPIVDWLGSDKHRYEVAGIDAMSIVVKKMEETKLCDLKCRLGVRYCHQSSSSFESAVFVTDRRMATSNGNCFPIIHDIWLHSDVTCGVCLGRPATKATATTSDLGHRALCGDCCRLLRVPGADQRCYTVWEAG